MKTFLYRYSNYLLVLLFSFLIHSKALSQQVNSNFNVDKDVQCVVNNQFRFINQSKGDSLQYNWDFNDGTYSSETNPIKSYTNDGNYLVTLTVSKNGNNYYYSKQITVAPMPLLSSIDIQSTFLGKSYTYISNSTIAFGSMTYFWNFADSIGSSLINPVHTYKDTGTYDVELIVISNYGCTSKKVKSVKITESDSTTLIPKFSVNNAKQCLQNNQFHFNYTGDTTGIVSLKWEFGDGTFDSSITVNKTYSQSGHFFVKLIVLKSGVTYTNEKIITISDIHPTFEAVKQIEENNYLFFIKNLESISNNLFLWNFGDGCTASEPNPLHNFNKGNYTVKLYVTNDIGCIDSSFYNVNVLIADTTYTASFNVNNATQYLATNNFIFTNTSTQKCNFTYLWNFGDGTYANTYNANKTFADTGVYKVTLTVNAGLYSKIFEQNVKIVNINYWLGNTDQNWFNATNWSSGIPNSQDNICITKIAKYKPLISNSTITINNITIENTATIQLNNATINISGNIIASNTIFTNSTNSKINFIGTKIQSITGLINIGKITIDNTSEVIVNCSNNDSVNIFQILTLKNGKFSTNNKVVLKSTATQTAQLDKVNTAGNIGTIEGEVTVERYFQNKRAWRFLTIPFAADNNLDRYSIKNTIQKFTNVTGPTGIGFDFLSPAYSLNAWNDLTNGWDNIKNTSSYYTVNNKSNFANVPFFIFVRGDKSIVDAWNSSALNFSFSGKLQTGNQQQSFSGKKKGNYAFIGNPYASAVDLAVVQAQSQGLAGNFYLWDPTINANGAYVTISNKGNGVWIATPAAAQRGRYLQSGQAMLFQVSDTVGNIKFTESAKADTNYINTFGSASQQMDMLTVNLYRINNDNSKTLVDGAITLFNKNYSIDVDDNDSKKILNPEENIGFKNGTDILAIETRPFVNKSDSVSVYTSGLIDGVNYAIEVIANYTDTTVQEIILIDSNNQNKSSISFYASSWYSFTHQTSSYNNNSRFSFYIKSTKSVNGVVKGFKVMKQNDDALLNWFVDAEQGVKEYQIQYSKNGIDFTTILIKNAVNNNQTNSYTISSLLNGAIGKHYYRIKTILTNDVELISKNEVIEFIKLPTVNKDFYVYPNPTKEKVIIHIYSDAEQWITLQVIEPITGRTVATQYKSLHKGENNFTVNLKDYKQLVNGMYTINFLSDNIKLNPVNIIYNK